MDSSGPPILDGWLQKRGPTFEYKWETRWCVLKRMDGILKGQLCYYKDQEACKQNEDPVGRIGIASGTLAHFLKSSKAPGEAAKHSGQRPCGFVVDVDVNAGKKRHFHYFDASEKEHQKMWVEGIRNVAAGTAGSAPSAWSSAPSASSSAGTVRPSLKQAEERTCDPPRFALSSEASPSYIQGLMRRSVLHAQERIDKDTASPTYVGSLLRRSVLHAQERQGQKEADSSYVGGLLRRSVEHAQERKDEKEADSSYVGSLLRRSVLHAEERRDQKQGDSSYVGRVLRRGVLQSEQRQSAQDCRL